jgi:hypothetical protein
LEYPTPPLKISPATLTRAYDDAGYLSRNMRTVEVLVDRDAVASGTAAAGEPWQHYDLGHGYCTYTFFEQCPHRMACAKCDFYTPKDSSKAQLLEAKDNLQRMLTAIPLTDDERGACRRRSGRPGQAPGTPRGRPYPSRADTPPDRPSGSGDAAPGDRGQARAGIARCGTT